jgi:hypothetical protein
MANSRITLNEQALQRLFTGDLQLAQLWERIRNQVREALVREPVQAQRSERSEERHGDSHRLAVA